jgi:hypothetical protein
METCPLYKNCSSNKNTSYPTEFTGITCELLIPPLCDVDAVPDLHDPGDTGSSPDGGSGPQKNFRKKRLRAARMHLCAWTRRPSTLKVTSLKAWPLMRRLR